MSASPSAVPGPRAARLLPWVCTGGVLGVVASLTMTAVLREILGRTETHDPAASALAPLAVGAVLNVAGAFALGLLRGRAARAATRGRAWDPRVVPTLGTGFLGSFTSFSALAAPLGALLGRSVIAGEGGTCAALAPVGLVVALLAGVGTLAAAAGLRLGRGAAA